MLMVFGMHVLYSMSGETQQRSFVPTSESSISYNIRALKLLPGIIVAGQKRQIERRTALGSCSSTLFFGLVQHHS